MTCDDDFNDVYDDINDENDHECCSEMRNAMTEDICMFLWLCLTHAPTPYVNMTLLTLLQNSDDDKSEVVSSKLPVKMSMLMPAPGDIMAARQQMKSASGKNVSEDVKVTSEPNTTKPLPARVSTEVKPA